VGILLKMPHHPSSPSARKREREQLLRRRDTPIKEYKSFSEATMKAGAATAPGSNPRRSFHPARDLSQKIEAAGWLPDVAILRRVWATLASVIGVVNQAFHLTLWRKRFAEAGLDGLWDVAPGRGRKPTYKKPSRRRENWSGGSPTRSLLRKEPCNKFRRDPTEKRVRVGTI
jgi:hypothetical protein